MALVKVIVVDPDGNEWDAQVDPDESDDVIEQDLLDALGLRATDGYKIRRGSGRIREGAVIVVDKAKPSSVQLGGKRRLF